MFNDFITPHLEYLMAAAISKCGSLTDAEDLVQETVLAALKQKDAAIENPRAWLTTVMTRRYYDMLRRKYQLPTVTIGADFDIACEDDTASNLISREEAEDLRREVAYLADSYRKVIVRRYFKNESVKDIAVSLGIPVGTVKSRLDFGRKQIKKGFDTMEKYKANSYEPQGLALGISGECGLDNHPFCLVEGDVLAQNLLILAYDKPLTVTELSKAIGVATAYVEPIIEKLIDGDLMKRTGDGKIYTNFILYHISDWVRYIKEQEAFAKTHANAYIAPLKEAIKELKATDFYSERLERFMMIRIAEEALWQSKGGLSFDEFPDRPHGGKWIAFGIVRPDDYTVPEESKGKEEYMYNGRRVQSLAKYMNKVNLELHNYETSLNCFSTGAKYKDMWFASVSDIEKALTKLIYLIKHGIDPETVDLDPRIIEAMPLLEQRGFIDTENGKHEVLVPCLSHEQHKKLCAIIKRTAAECSEMIKEPMAQYLKAHRKEIPAHLTGVPEDRLSMPYEPNAMMLVYEAVSAGVHPRDLGYPCPETIAVFD